MVFAIAPRLSPITSLPSPHPSLLLLSTAPLTSVASRLVSEAARSAQFTRRPFHTTTTAKRCYCCLSLSLTDHPPFCLSLYFFQPMRKEPEVVTVTLKKHNGMGLSIVAAKVRKLHLYPKIIQWNVRNSILRIKNVFRLCACMYICICI